MIATRAKAPSIPLPSELDLFRHSHMQSLLRSDPYQLVPSEPDTFYRSRVFSLMHSNPYRAVPSQYDIFVGSVVYEAMAAPLVWTTYTMHPAALVSAAPTEVEVATSMQPPSQANPKADYSNSLPTPAAHYATATTPAALSAVSALPVHISASAVSVTTSTGSHVTLPSAAATFPNSNAAVTTTPSAPLSTKSGNPFASAGPPVLPAFTHPNTHTAVKGSLYKTSFVDIPLRDSPAEDDALTGNHAKGSAAVINAVYTPAGQKQTIASYSTHPVTALDAAYKAAPVTKTALQQLPSRAGSFVVPSALSSPPRVPFAALSRASPALLNRVNAAYGTTLTNIAAAEAGSEQMAGEQAPAQGPSLKKKLSAKLSSMQVGSQFLPSTLDCCGDCCAGCCVVCCSAVEGSAH